MKLNSISKFQARCKRESCPLCTVAGLFVHALVDFPTFATQQRFAKRYITPANNNSTSLETSDCTSSHLLKLFPLTLDGWAGVKHCQTTTNNCGED